MAELPYNIHAEEAVLGEVLRENNLSYAKVLNPGDFYAVQHRIIFTAMQELDSKNEPIDVITLSNCIKSKNKIDTIGGYVYLTELVMQAVSITLMPHHIKIVKEDAIKREIINRGMNINEKIQQGQLDELMEEIRKFYTDFSLIFSLKPTPLSLPEFLKQDIPPVEYYIEGMLQKEGRAMISASMNVGKSFFLQNLAITIATGKDKFLDRFNVTQAHVLYLDLEMGEPALKQRFLNMAKDMAADNLFVKYEPSFDLLEIKDQQVLEKWIFDLKIDVLIIDPIGDAWSGNENEKQEVVQLTSYLNILRSKCKISILMSHHWRKRTKDSKRGGEMASGSYKWGAWLDHHVTLEGDINSVIVNCEKSRNSAKFEPFMIKLNKDSFFFEFLADFEQKFNEQTLIKLFDSFGLEKVLVKDLCKKAEDDEICSEDTIRGLIKKSKVFEIDSSKKAHAIYKKQSIQKQEVNLFDNRTSEKGVVG